MKVFLQAATNPAAEPLIEILALACETAARLLSILDDDEVFVDEDPVSLGMLRDISSFVNQFVFKALWRRAKETDPFMKVSDFSSKLRNFS